MSLLCRRANFSRWPRCAGLVFGGLICGGVAHSVQAGTLDSIFRDGFDSFVPACVAGPVSGPSLGTLPSGPNELLACIELREDLNTTRNGELALGGIALPRSAGLLDSQLNRLVLVGPGGRRLPAQFAALSRWGRPLNDSAAAIRWLELGAVTDQPANTTTTLALLRYPLPVPALDPDALSVSDQGGGVFLVDTGSAQFRVDSALPQLLRQVVLRDGAELDTVYNYSAGVPGHGWRVDLSTAVGNTPLLVAANEFPGSLQVDRFEWLAQGPATAAAKIDGHIEVAGDNDTCLAAAPSYPAYAFSVVMRWTRGARHVDMEWQFINACSDLSSDWTDQAVRVSALSFGWPLNLGNPALAVAVLGGAAAGSTQAPGTTARFEVLQRRGVGAGTPGDPWSRRAEVRNASASQVLEQGEAFANSSVGVIGSVASASLHAPWLRYREPQGYEVEQQRLAFRLIAEPLILGEGKGLWFSGRLAFDVGAGLNPAARLALWEQRRAEARAALERGLLPHSRLADFNASGILPDMGTGAASPVYDAYRLFMVDQHADTVRDTPCVVEDIGGGTLVGVDGGQWSCAKTYGVQIWPDVQFDNQFFYTYNPHPDVNDLRFNYWNPAGAELVEFLRSGEPRWVWEFALPQSWLQSHTAYLNQGFRPGSLRNGFGPVSGGNGEGHWHRTGQGSSDYSYNRGQHLAYAIRPSAGLRDRFAQMGRTASDRFVSSSVDSTNRITIGRFNFQYFEGLANCAEFVPGTAGSDCDTRLRQYLDELVADNLSAGIFCEDQEIPGASCFFGQQFMITSMFYPWFARLYRNYEPTLSVATRNGLRRALVEAPQRYRQYGIPTAAGGGIDVGQDWAGALVCQQSGPGFSSVDSCAPFGDVLIFENKPHTLSLIYQARALEPGLPICAENNAALDTLFSTANPLGALAGYGNNGWYKGAAQVMQELPFAIGGYEACAP